MNAASLVFLQTGLHSWRGRLVNKAQCIDNGRRGLPAADARFDIIENPVTGKCSVLVQGASYHGRRWVSYDNLDAAQAGGLRWARRRFRRVED